MGGDYYDFLELGPGRMGIVMADIAGKGISGALLMANLQANLRSQCALALESGDLLVVYTDGVTEAANSDGEEFGEERLTEVVRAYRLASAGALLKVISTEVQLFSCGEQADDLTLVVAKSR